MKKLTNALTLLIMALLSGCSSPECPKEQVEHLLSAAIAIEDNDAVAALDMYEEAYDLLLPHPDSTLLRETHFRMGLLFMRNALPEECITSLQEAAHLDSALRDTVSWFKTLRSIAFAYESRGQIPEASQTIHKILTEMTSLETDLRRKADLDYYDRYHYMSDILTQMPDSYIEDLDRLTPLSTELEVAYAGWQAEQAQDYATAINRYQKLTSKRSYYVQAFGQLHTARIQLLLGQQADAAKSLDKYEEINGLIRKSEQTTKHILQRHAQYQDRRARHKIAHLELLNQRQWRTIILITASSILAIILLLLLLRLYRQRQIILKFRLEKMRTWREEYLSKSEQQRQQSTDATAQTDIYRNLRQKLNGGDNKPLTDNEWKAVEASVLATYPAFKQRLFDFCRLSNHDYHICLLLKIGIKPSEIARLTFRSDEAISSTRRRLYERAFGQKGAPNSWDEVIKTL